MRVRVYTYKHITIYIHVGRRVEGANPLDSSRMEEAPGRCRLCITLYNYMFM